MKNHSLFPVDEGEDELDVGYIHVTRFNGGKAVYAPKLYAAEELTGLDQLSELYGGGEYELIARDPGKRHVIARVRYTIEGKPRSLSGEAEREESRSAPVAMPPSPVSNGGLDAGTMLQFITMMMGQLQAQSQQSMQLVMAILQNGKQDANTHIQTMQALHDRAASSQTTLFTTLIDKLGAGGGAGGGSGGGFMDGVEFAQEFLSGMAQQQKGADADADLSNTFGQMMQAAGEFMKMTNAAKQQNQVPAPASAPANAA